MVTSPSARLAEASGIDVEQFQQRGLHKLASAALFGLFALACTPMGALQQPAKVGEDIVVGVPLDASGATSREAALTRRGYDLWQDWANRDGGIVVQGVKHRVELLYADDAGKPEVSAAAAQHMVSTQGARFLLGPVGVPNIIATGEVAERNKVPLIATVVGAPAAPGAPNQPHKYVFGVLPPPETAGRPFVDLAANVNPRPQKWALLVSNDPFSVFSAKAAIDYVVEKGFQVVLYQTYPVGTTNLLALVQQAKATNPDVVADVGYLLDAVAIQKAAMDLRLESKMFIYTIGPSAPEYTQALGPAADYAYTVSPWTARARYRATYYLSGPEYIDAYRKRFNTSLEPDFLAADATASGIALQAAIEHAQSLDPTRVRDALSALDISTFYGRIKFDSSGQDVFHPMLVEQIQNGIRQTVWPPESASAPATYPAPTWTARFGPVPRGPKPKLPVTGHPPSWSPPPHQG